MASTKKVKVASRKKKVAKKKVAKKKVAKTRATQKRVVDEAELEQPVTELAGPLVLDEKIGIQNIASLVDRLGAVLKSGHDVVIDAKGVQTADIAALQVLVAFSNSARRQGSEIDWKCTEGTLPELAELAGLNVHLQFDGSPAPVEDDGLCPVF